MTERTPRHALSSLPALEALNTENAAALIEALQDLIDLVWALHGDGIGRLRAEQKLLACRDPTD